MLDVIPNLLLAAWLVPLASFVLIVLVGPRLGKAGVLGGYVATGAIVLALGLSLAAFFIWQSQAPDSLGPYKDAKFYLSDYWYEIGPSGLTLDDDSAGAADPEATRLKVTVGYFIDALTIGMFVVVTLIASCIHFYAMGYMHEELHDVTDHETTTSDGSHLHRPGRYHRFFQYMSLFCFSMLGLVIAGNIAMTFVFWELVGICSYFLIGFYYERKNASNAANKAFIVNRVGDFGMIIGLMALWGSLGTFAFGDAQAKTADGQYEVKTTEDHGHKVVAEPGIFSLVRPPREKHGGEEEGEHAHHGNVITVPAGMVQAGGGHEGGYWLLVVAGVGIFCGCVGKSAQFPLHVWLPDAMEGPTPVSALVHSATMVAAGVYLVGRFFPVFTPEVLLVIAIIGTITLLLAATIAITAVDIKRVLAYSTVSQLGYMMLALGLGGWVAGLFHLITHAFFKSLLFMCSGSVIHACHTNDMRQMGGLRHKMPWTAYTMLVGCLAIAGAPFFSGFYSKDAIVAQAFGFASEAGVPGLGNVFLYASLIGASITAFYMFRLWYMTFAGEPRDEHVHEHVHESPKVMYVPLVVLAFFAVTLGWPLFGVVSLLEQAQPDGTVHVGAGTAELIAGLTYPDEHKVHKAYHNYAIFWATVTALAGFLLATVMYLKRSINADEVRKSFKPIYSLFWNKWWFDEIYHTIFVRPTLFFSRLISRCDRRVIDWLIDNTARGTVRLAKTGDEIIDRTFVDGLVNLMASWIHSFANWLRIVQTGQLRQYVVFIVAGTVALFVLISFWSNT